MNFPSHDYFELIRDIKTKYISKIISTKEKSGIVRKFNDRIIIISITKTVQF